MTTAHLPFEEAVLLGHLDDELALLLVGQRGREVVRQPAEAGLGDAGGQVRDVAAAQHLALGAGLDLVGAGAADDEEVLLGARRCRRAAASGALYLSSIASAMTVKPLERGLRRPFQYFGVPVLKESCGTPAPVSGPCSEMRDASCLGRCRSWCRSRRPARPAPARRRRRSCRRRPPWPPPVAAAPWCRRRSAAVVAAGRRRGRRRPPPVVAAGRRRRRPRPGRLGRAASTVPSPSVSTATCADAARAAGEPPPGPARAGP